MVRLLDWLETAVKWLAGLCLFMVFALVTAQVVSRHFLDFPLVAASELSIYSMIWAVFLGAAVGFRHNSHIAMNIVRNMFGPRLSRLATFVIFVCLATFLCLIIVEGYDLSQRAMRQASTAAGLPVGYVSFAMPVGSVLAMIFLIENTILQLRQAQQRD